ncbi:MAG: AbrB/MazE/SpoVT family DNA-binding domain-containing protein [Clostridiales bacterium]|nr:AbrB/MazE/SpoVT family DNA-binding domain-containing protein [Clostridiales bacterium]
MKATGIVRRIDDLGRVVIPKEIRRTMRIREGDPLEIYTDSEGEVIFKKYSPIGELSEFAGQYTEVLNRATGLPVLISDRDHIISCSGISKKDVMDRRVSAPLEALMERRASYAYTSESTAMHPVEGLERSALVVYPIVGGGDISGAVMLLQSENGGVPTQTEIKLAQVAASFLGKQMEE